MHTEKVALILLGASILTACSNDVRSVPSGDVRSLQGPAVATVGSTVSIQVLADVRGDKTYAHVYQSSRDPFEFHVDTTTYMVGQFPFTMTRDPDTTRQACQPFTVTFTPHATGTYRVTAPLFHPGCNPSASATLDIQVAAAPS